MAGSGQERRVDASPQKIRLWCWQPWRAQESGSSNAIVYDATPGGRARTRKRVGVLREKGGTPK